jgi:hypothetical protein
MRIEDRMSLWAAKKPRDEVSELLLEGAQEIADRRRVGLTDDEREAIRRLLHWVANRPCSELPNDVDADHTIACGVFERLGGEQ